MPCGLPQGRRREVDRRHVPRHRHTLGDEGAENAVVGLANPGVGEAEDPRRAAAAAQGYLEQDGDGVDAEDGAAADGDGSFEHFDRRWLQTRRGDAAITGTFRFRRSRVGWEV